ncbi:MAG TPA: hypothetical protein VM846_16200 [Vicinamibacterales bacterium]|nr:hypothetical protein [Vicinamibacterales bacterium]
MNFAHLHLVMNHVPTIGSVVALGLLILGYTRRNEHLKHVGLEVLFLIALLTLPVYVSGVAAHQELRETAGVSVEAIRVHQDAAIIGFSVMEFAGFIAWLALWQWRRHGRAAAGVVPAATILLLLSLVVMGRAANIGGEIRHPEILASGAPAPEGDPKRFMAYAIGQVAVYSSWAWPAAEAIHFLGLSLSFGVLLAVNLRILGAMRRIPFDDVHRLLPWGMLGFGANLITGMFFFVGQPGQYTASNPFYWKIAFLMIAGANFLYLTVFGKPWPREGRVEAGFQPGAGDKAMAVLSLVSWFGVLYAGRMLPFLGKSF